MPCPFPGWVAHDNKQCGHTGALFRHDVNAHSDTGAAQGGISIMAMLFKKISTRPLPDGATVYRRGDTWYGEWLSRGKKRKAKVDGENAARYQQESSTYYCRHRDAFGRVVEVNTKCTDKEMAARVAQGLQADTEKIISGLITETEAETLQWANIPLLEQMEHWRAYMEAKGLHKNTVSTRCHYVETILNELRFRRWADVSKTKIEQWLLDKVNREGMGHRTHNAYVAACVAFGNWGIKQTRIMKNPFKGIEKKSEKVDRRRIRKAFTPSEAARLIDAALMRPVNERLTNRGSKATLSAKTLDTLQWLGITRAMGYRVLFGTGLRYSEMRSITIGQCSLESNPPFITLAAKDEKNRQGAEIVLQAELARDMASYIRERVRRLTSDYRHIPINGVYDAPVFNLPLSLKKVFDADLKAAGISKRDDKGRTFDVHCTRHTYISWLAQAGVSPQATRELARHSDINLTAAFYTHHELEHKADAVQRLPDYTALPGNLSVALPVALTAGKTCKYESFSGTSNTFDKNGQTCVSPNNSRGFRKKKWRAQQDSNLRPLAPEASALSN